MGRILLALACLLSLLALSHAQNDTDASGSGSGSGSGDIDRNCTDLQCSHGCNQTEEGPICYCPMGYSLGADLMTCQACPGGMWGVGCSMTCDCGMGGNTCDRVNGSCICNPCYSGDQCAEDSDSYDCFVQFLGISDKNEDNLRNFYGTMAYPYPPLSVWERLVYEGIMDTTRPSLISAIRLEEVSRDAVEQGPLIKLSWLVDNDADRVEAERALAELSNKVKLGEIRATYIQQDSESGDSTLVTLNAGIKRDPI